MEIREPPPSSFYLKLKFDLPVSLNLIVCEALDHNLHLYRWGFRHFFDDARIRLNERIQENDGTQ